MDAANLFATIKEGVIGRGSVREQFQEPDEPHAACASPPSPPSRPPWPTGRSSSRTNELHGCSESAVRRTVGCGLCVRTLSRGSGKNTCGLTRWGMRMALGGRQCARQGCGVRRMECAGTGRGVAVHPGGRGEAHSARGEISGHQEEGDGRAHPATRGQLVRRHRPRQRAAGATTAPRDVHPERQGTMHRVSTSGGVHQRREQQRRRTKMGMESCQQEFYRDRMLKAHSFAGVLTVAAVCRHTPQRVVSKESTPSRHVEAHGAVEGGRCL